MATTKGEPYEFLSDSPTDYRQRTDPTPVHENLWRSHSGSAIAPPLRPAPPSALLEIPHRMLDRESFYSVLPVPIQNLICSVEGYRIQRRRFGASFPHVLRHIEERSKCSGAQVREFRDRRLRDYVHHCASRVPHYQTWFAQNNVHPTEIRKLDDLHVLPVVTKNDVQTRVARFVSAAVPGDRRIWVHTSGTTGAGLRFPTTADAVREQWAIWWRYRQWHGLHRDTRDTWCGYVGGRTVVPVTQDRPPFWRYNVPGKQLLLSGFHMSPANLPSYIDELRRQRPPWLHGYPSLIALLGRYIADNNVDLGYQVRWITLGAENVLPHQIDVIEKAFGVRPRQHYGMTEAVANISECKSGKLHVDEDFSAVEFVPTSRDGEYRIVGSNLSNPATALLRYDTGDIVELSDAACSCGLPGRLVATVHGRDEDYIVLPNGALIGRLDHAFKDMVNVRESQLYQRSADEVVVRIVRGCSYGDRDEQALLMAIQSRIGHTVAIKVDYVESLERSPAGKLRFVISDLPEGRLRGP